MGLAEYLLEVSKSMDFSRIGTGHYKPTLVPQPVPYDKCTYCGTAAYYVVEVEHIDNGMLKVGVCEMHKEKVEESGGRYRWWEEDEV